MSFSIRWTEKSGWVRRKSRNFCLGTITNPTGLERHDGRRARAAIEHYLAEVFPRTLGAKHDLLASVVAQENLHAAGENNIERVRLVALIDDHGLLGKGLDDPLPRKRTQLCFRERKCRGIRDRRHRTALLSVKRVGRFYARGI